MRWFIYLGYVSLTLFSFLSSFLPSLSSLLTLACSLTLSSHSLILSFLFHSLFHSLSLSLSAVLSLVTIKKLECLKQVLLLECWPLHIAVWNNRLDLCLSAGHTPGLRFAGCAARGLDRDYSLVQGVASGEQGSAAEVEASCLPYLPLLPSSADAS